MFIKDHFKGWLLSLFLITNFIIWYAVFSEERNMLTVVFFDVGQGDAIFIESPDGKQILIDGGANSQVLRQLTKVMPFYDRSIDMVILTHPDQDHIGGLSVVLENYKVDFVMEPGVFSNNGTYQEFENIIEEKGIKKILARQGMNISLCNFPEVEPRGSCGSYLEVLFPIEDVDVTDFDSNTASIVLKLTYGENSFLFTGDSPQSIEKYLVSAFGKNLDVDVLKLGHHGSKTSTSDLFLGFTSPDIAIVSAGKDNRYGHPHKEVLSLLGKFEIDILKTYEDGNIVIKSNGDSIFVK